MNHHIHIINTFTCIREALCVKAKTCIAQITYICMIYSTYEVVYIDQGKHKMISSLIVLSI